jgi:bacillithiol system protein YtxJ
MPKRLRTPAEIDQAFASADFVLFKHSTRCPISAAAFDEYQRWSRAHPEVTTAWIDVIQERDLARTVAQRTGIAHESPQAIRLAAGRPCWNASHGEITVASLTAACVAPRSSERG